MYWVFHTYYAFCFSVIGNIFSFVYILLHETNRHTKSDILKPEMAGEAKAEVDHIGQVKGHGPLALVCVYPVLFQPRVPARQWRRHCKLFVLISFFIM